MAGASKSFGRWIHLVCPVPQELVKSGRPHASFFYAHLDESKLPHNRWVPVGKGDTWDRTDAAALKEVLREDAALEMVGSRTWFSGLRTCLPFITSPQVLGSPGDWRMVPTAANGQPAAATYLRSDSGTHVAYGIAVLTPGTDGIARIVVFGDPELVSAFGFPAVLSPSRAVDGVVEHHDT
jgi:hypothetical protein